MVQEVTIPVDRVFVGMRVADDRPPCFQDYRRQREILQIDYKAFRHGTSSICTTQSLVSDARPGVLVWHLLNLEAVMPDSNHLFNEVASFTRWTSKAPLYPPN